MDLEANGGVAAKRAHNCARLQKPNKIAIVSLVLSSIQDQRGYRVDSHNGLHGFGLLRVEIGLDEN